MSVHYIIDGYNVIKQVDFLTSKKLRNGRDSLVKFIEQYRPHGSVRNEVTIVFDGKAEFDHPAPKTFIKIIFSKNEPADDTIKRMVEASGNPRRIVVITDDRQIVYYCRSIGAKIKSVKKFLSNIGVSKKKSGQKKKTDNKPGLDSLTEAKITEDLKNLWVK